MRHQPTPCPICRKLSERQFDPFCSRECSDADLDLVRAELADRIEELTEELLGAPSLKRRNAWRFGAKGSLEVITGGHKRGAWISRETGNGGGPLDLICHGRACSIADAISWARTWTGRRIDPSRDYRAEAAERKANRERKAQESADQEAADRARRVGTAQRLWRGRKPIGGTVAEAYLHHRGLNFAAPRSWPDAVAFHPGSCSLIVGATLADGTLQAVQRVRLTPEGRKAVGTPEQPVKQTNGVLASAAVRLPGDPQGPLLLAEGPETGLSVWAATGAETWIALGSMAALDLPLGRQIVVCRDDDAKHSPSDKAIIKTVAAWRKAGHSVAVATPWQFRQYNKSDFNDTIQRDGAGGIRRRIEAALNPGGNGPERLPIKVVREQLRKAMAGFFDEVRAWSSHETGLPPSLVADAGLSSDPMDAADWAEVFDAPLPDAPSARTPPVHAIKTDVGSGKTLAAYSEAIRLLTEMRAAGDKRAGVVAIPTHRLADEQAVIFALHARHTDLTAAVWRGMSAANPDTPGETMCLRLDDVQDARDAMLDVYKSTCKRKLDNGEFAVCPFFGTCGYQRQRESSADLWITPHELIYMEKPRTIGKVAFLIVDEAVWQDGLEGHHGRPKMLSLDSMASAVPLPIGASLMERENVQRLEYLRGHLLPKLQDLEPGPVPSEPLIDSDLSPENTREAYRLEWSRHVDVGMHPGMSKAERREAVHRAAGNAHIPRLADVWTAITALLEDGGPRQSGWAAIAMQPTEHGPVKVLHLKGRKKIRKGWQVPTLLIDATMNIDLVRPFWPNVQLVADLLADAPHQTIRQVVDRAFSKSAIEPLTPDMPGYSEDEARRRQRGLRNVHAIIGREARRWRDAPRHNGISVLVVAQKATKEALPSFGPMAPYVDLAHHNAVAGRDQWRNVRALVVVGRTQPAPASVERLAEALTGCAVTPIKGWYQRGDAVRHTESGKVAIEADRHPDPICEAIRWQVCEGELVQIIGRGRGINRTEDDPLDVLVLTDAPLPLPVAETLHTADLAPTPDDLMLAAGGIAFRNPTDAAAAYPQLWGNREAAKKAVARARLGTFPYKNLLLGECPQPLPIEYQAAGAGRSRGDAVYDPDLAHDPVARLAALIGPLVWDSITGGSPPPPSPSADRPTVPAIVPPNDTAHMPPDHPDDPGWQPDTEPAELHYTPDHAQMPRAVTGNWAFPAAQRALQPAVSLAGATPLPDSQTPAPRQRGQPAHGPPW